MTSKVSPPITDLNTVTLETHEYAAQQPTEQGGCSSVFVLTYDESYYSAHFSLTPTWKATQIFHPSGKGLTRTNLCHTNKPYNNHVSQKLCIW